MVFEGKKAVFSLSRSVNFCEGFGTLPTVPFSMVILHLYRSLSLSILISFCRRLLALHSSSSRVCRTDAQCGKLALKAFAFVVYLVMIEN